MVHQRHDLTKRRSIFKRKRSFFHQGQMSRLKLFAHEYDNCIAY